MVWFGANLLPVSPNSLPPHQSLYTRHPVLQQGPLLRPSHTKLPHSTATEPLAELSDTVEETGAPENVGTEVVGKGEDVNRDPEMSCPRHS